MSTGIIILAAGNSSRLGHPKQILCFRGITLLETTIQAALQASFSPIVVVLGAYAQEILTAHQNLPVQFIINKNWQEGMSSSIISGVKRTIELAPETTNLIITVSDQPFITHETFRGLVTNKENIGKNIIASQYAETWGTPVLFDKKYFKQLLSLKGNIGAKHMLTQYVNDVSTIPFELGAIDIDTAIDFKNLTEQT